MEATTSPSRPSNNDVLALRLLQTNPWSCYCGLPLWGFTPAKLKEIMRNMLSDLPDSEGRRPRLLCRPCSVLSSDGRQGEEAFFCVAASASQKPHAAGLVHCGEKVSLVLLSGSAAARSVMARQLGEGFGVTLMALQLAPWQLSLVMLWGCSDLGTDESPEKCFLKLGMDGITLGFSRAQVLHQLPRSTGLTYNDGRKLLLAFCEIASKEVLSFNYQQLPLRLVHFVDLFSVDSEGTMNVHKSTLVPELFEMLLFFVKNSVLGPSSSDHEVD
nr:uncharacterized protein LOC119170805 [Rhipicephalus microplus]XP_037277961.1 uncharacterized protein LOC119170805 [Rhipicephalus microplus]